MAARGGAQAQGARVPHPHGPGAGRHRRGPAGEWPGAHGHPRRGPRAHRALRHRRSSPSSRAGAEARGRVSPAPHSQPVASCARQVSCPRTEPSYSPCGPCRVHLSRWGGTGGRGCGERSVVEGVGRGSGGGHLAGCGPVPGDGSASPSSTSHYTPTHIRVKPRADGAGAQHGHGAALGDERLGPRQPRPGRVGRHLLRHGPVPRGGALLHHSRGRRPRRLRALLLHRPPRLPARRGPARRRVGRGRPPPPRSGRPSGKSFSLHEGHCASLCAGFTFRPIQRGARGRGGARDGTGLRDDWERHGHLPRQGAGAGDGPLDGRRRVLRQLDAVARDPARRSARPSAAAGTCGCPTATRTT